MKKIFMYIFLLILTIVVVRVFVYFMTKTYYKDMNNYKILITNPEISVTESKLYKNRGYVKGTIKNNTGSLMNNVSVRLKFYDKNGNLLSTEYSEEIKTFNNTETAKFEVKYSIYYIDRIEIDIEQ